MRTQEEVMKEIQENTKQMHLISSQIDPVKPFQIWLESNAKRYYELCQRESSLLMELHSIQGVPLGGIS